MRRILLASTLGVVATAGAAQDIEIDRQNRSITTDMRTVPLHIGGRTHRRSIDSFPKDAASYSHEWPGVYFEAAFDGDAVFLKFSDPSNEYRLLIDNYPSLTLAQTGQVEIAITGLGNAVHHARLEKVTESVWITGAFDGFYISNSAKTLPPEARSRQIEFIGDSDMTGYGIRSSTQICTQEEVRLMSDTQIAYPALVAKRLDADYQINAISGRGLVRNYGGGSDHAMTSVYQDILPDIGKDIPSYPYVDDQWKPGIIVIGLGDNDFSTPLLPSEAWATNDALIDDFLTNYKTLLGTLHQANPDAALVILKIEPTILADSEKVRLSDGMQNGVTNAAKAVGFRNVDLVSISDLSPQRSACDYHASKADHQRRADWFVKYIEQMPLLWAEK
jgi:lysophospholipase L1-like esterase